MAYPFMRNQSPERERRVTLILKCVMPQRLMTVAPAILCLMLVSTVQGGVIYVNHLAIGANNGTSWANAFTDLHDALAVSQPGEEIWIAKGTYKPDQGTGNRALSYHLNAGVTVYGGFAGNEVSVLQRNFAASETILSGDLNDDDGAYDCSSVSNCCAPHNTAGCDEALCQTLMCGDPNNAPTCCFAGNDWSVFCADLAKQRCCHLTAKSCENSYHVLVGAPSGSGPLPVILDGLTVTGGNADYADCIYEPGNNDCAGGGFLAFGDGNLVIRNSSFRSNAGLDGAALTTIGMTSVTLDSASFVDNRVGRAVEVYDNVARTGQVAISNCEFTYNLGARGNAALDIRAEGVVMDTRFEGTAWGALIIDSADVVVEGCAFQDNHEYYAVVVQGNEGPIEVEIRDSSFLDNTGGVLADFGSSPVVRNCYFEGHEFSPAATSFGHLTLENCFFTKNGAPIGINNSSLEANSCAFIGNLSPFYPGAVSVSEGSGTFRNCLFSGNVSHTSASVAAMVTEGSAAFSNCTFVGNYSGLSEMIVVGFDSAIILENSILWDNCYGQNCGESGQIWLDPRDPGAIGIFNYNTIAGWTGSLGGVSNDGNDPLFLDADGPDDMFGTLDDDPRLSPASLAIDSGDPNFVPDANETDLDGHARVLCGLVDRGAYESGIGDADCNRSVDLRDVSAMQRCFTGVSSASDSSLSLRMTGCEPFDFNSDDSINLEDLGLFNAVLTGP